MPGDVTLWRFGNLVAVVTLLAEFLQMASCVKSPSTPCGGGTRVDAVTPTDHRYPLQDDPYTDTGPAVTTSSAGPESDFVGPTLFRAVYLFVLDVKAVRARECAYRHGNIATLA